VGSSSINLLLSAAVSYCSLISSVDKTLDDLGDLNWLPAAAAEMGRLKFGSNFRNSARIANASGCSASFWSAKASSLFSQFSSFCRHDGGEQVRSLPSSW
jgi:hypothetical protein